jgi:hypothetical protein
MGDGEGVGFADVDLVRIEEVRGILPAIRHRRPIPAPEIAETAVVPPSPLRRRTPLPAR